MVEWCWRTFHTTNLIVKGMRWVFAFINMYKGWNDEKISLFFHFNRIKYRYGNFCSFSFQSSDRDNSNPIQNPICIWYRLWKFAERHNFIKGRSFVFDLTWVTHSPMKWWILLSKQHYTPPSGSNKAVCVMSVVSFCQNQRNLWKNYQECCQNWLLHKERGTWYGLEYTHIFLSDN